MNKIDIDSLTLGQFKQISALVKGSAPNASSVASALIGKYVIVRSRNEGINAGFLESADAQGCVLSNARRLWYHKPKDKGLSWYEGVAVSGTSSDTKMSAPVERKLIMEDYSATVCSSVAEKSIQEAPSNAQS
jgi:hypothetical protein